MKELVGPHVHSRVTDAKLEVRVLGDRLDGVRVPIEITHIRRQGGVLAHILACWKRGHSTFLSEGKRGHSTFLSAIDNVITYVRRRPTLALYEA